MALKSLAKVWERGTDFLGTRYAILCGAMTWVSESNLVSAISNAGGFGVIAGGNMPPEALTEEIRKTREKTKLPFGAADPAGGGRAHHRGERGGGAHRARRDLHPRAGVSSEHLGSPHLRGRRDRHRGDDRPLPVARGVRRPARYPVRGSRGVHGAPPR